MEFEECCGGAIVRADHRVLVRCRVCIRIPKGAARVSAFYQKMTNAAITWTEKILGKRAQDDYLALSDIWEKARFLPYSFSLLGEPVFSNEKVVAMVCNSSLTHGSEREVRRAAQVWDLKEESVLPMRQIVRRWYGKRVPSRAGFRADGCYPVGQELVFFQNILQKSTVSEFKIAFSNRKNEKIEKSLAKSFII